MELAAHHSIGVSPLFPFLLPFIPWDLPFPNEDLTH